MQSLNDKEKYQLKIAFFKAINFDTDFNECIDIAINNLENGITDKNIAILAGLDPNDHFEIKKYVELIIKEELIQNNDDKLTCAGKHLISLAEQYFNNSLKLNELDIILWKIGSKYNYPEWIIELACASEDTLDLNSDVSFFNERLHFVIDLWKTSDNISSFISLYKNE
jgi:hypothetical protein